MSPTRATASLFLIAAFGLLSASAAEPPKAPAPIYTVDVYDPERNPADDLKAAVARAKKEKKRVLVQVGGEWCGGATG